MSKKTTPPWILSGPGQTAPIASFISVAQPVQKPIDENTVRLIQNRASGANNPDVLGSAGDVNDVGHESLLPALIKTPISAEQPGVRIGGPQCEQPYETSFLNASALSFGPMGKHFILALNRAAFKGNFYQNTGEAGLSPYHFGLDIDIESDDFNVDAFFDELFQKGNTRLQQAGALVWQLGNGYFGCRNADGTFNSEQFQRKATLAPVKMIEIKLSQGVEPAAKMPVKEVTPGIARLMGIDLANQAALQSQHSAFSCPVELLDFVKQLRTLSGGKPVGVKMGVSHRHYLLALCKAMRKTGVLLDFITVDGMEAGTAAAQAGSLGFTGTALNDAIVFVHNALQGSNLREHVKIIASGRVFTERDMVCGLARGADLFATARGMMLSVGCDQQLECYKGTCPRGIATQDPKLLRNFNTEQNTERLIQYHQLTIQGLKALVSMAGLAHPSQLRPYHVQKRVNVAEVLPLDEVYEFLEPGALFSPWPWLFPQKYKRAWAMADPNAPFTAPLSDRRSGWK